MTTSYFLIAVLIMGGITFLLRALPFWIAPLIKKSKLVSYLGYALPPAIMIILVLSTLDFKYSILIHDGSIPKLYLQLIASLSVIGLHLALRNVLISIIGGTSFYMALLYMFS